MNLEQIRAHCLAKPGVEESFPFDAETLAMKVGGKLFLLTHIDQPVSINLKCDPELAIELREKFDTILPGYHMNKKHWNTVMLQGRYGPKEIISWIDHSYNLVFNALPKKIRIEFDRHS